MSIENISCHREGWSADIDDSHYEWKEGDGEIVGTVTYPMDDHDMKDNRTPEDMKYPLDNEDKAMLRQVMVDYWKDEMP